MAVKRVKKPKTAAASKALEQLVSQFAQPLAFLRELVQNSLDASTELIEVDVAYDDESECCYVRVKDTGIGMDRNIIDTKLTRLFSSSKENDLTKIGKFGIGFVSIFAIKPQLVVLETGRDGESWRILFKPDRSFERRELKAPVEGTSVTVFTNKGKSELRQLQNDCRETIAFWCRHCEAEIHFNGQPTNQPFELPDVVFSYRHQVEGTDVVVAPSLEPLGFHGYYNRGLTLLEGQESPLPHVSFKLRSRYLEHTLSRDNILHDEHYEKAMAEVKLAAYTDLPAALLRRLGQHDDPKLWALARVVAGYPEPARTAFFNVAVFPSNGRNLHLGQLHTVVYIHPQVDDYWKAVEATGVTIVRATEGDEKTALLGQLGYSTVPISSVFLHFSPFLSAQLSPGEAELLADLSASDRELKRLVVVVGLQTPPSWRSRFCGLLRPDSGVAIEPCPAKGRAGESVAILREHPFWTKLQSLHAVQPELAVALGARKISLNLGLGTRGDAKLFSRLVKSIRVRPVVP